MTLSDQISEIERLLEKQPGVTMSEYHGLQTLIDANIALLIADWKRLQAENLKMKEELAERRLELSLLRKVMEAASVGLTIPCDGKTRPCGVCDLREALRPFQEEK